MYRPMHHGRRAHRALDAADLGVPADPAIDVSGARVSTARVLAAAVLAAVLAPAALNATPAFAQSDDDAFAESVDDPASDDDQVSEDSDSPFEDSESNEGEKIFEVPFGEADREAERQRMTLPEGMFLVQGYLEINLSADAALQPVSLAPDVWYGLTDVISLGLLHSAVASSGFYGGVGSSLCLVGDSNGCAGVYRNVGLAGRYNLSETELSMAVEGGLFAGDIDPLLLGLKVGVVGRYRLDPVALLFQPSFSLGLTERDAGNGDVFNLPVGVMFELSPAIALALQTGLSLGLEDPAELWQVPLTLGGRYALGNGIWVDAAFSLPAVAGGGEATGFDLRTLTLGVGTAL
ncbi:hypothetical protein [Haliangium ochraceum]|uniref:Uncharacterized protein n=1 Tax=Haliangium ochraceum (strain DSM 14365 / JCM 11303 / SMP-2) TaxID=502025 RepID=D0LXF7_HALO1|nr:hypothetical protein [Haliangium ochraceum]ACY17712.1 hypothetical protein Hoch_5227 [Haliangium ochraceum DSM 14365]